MQYADDTAFVANADLDTVVTLKIVLRLFTKMSGLSVNYQKSCFVALNLDTQHKEVVRDLLGCASTTLPMTYLGMPLTLQRPTRQCFLPLIEKIETRLEGWKSKLISRGGRLQLINSVMSSIPIYIMACFRLPKWVINRIDKIRRDFLWRKNDGSANGVSLTNWQSACLPKIWGGLGIPDLEIRNLALLIRWWWRLYDEPDSL